MIKLLLLPHTQFSLLVVGMFTLKVSLFWLEWRDKREKVSKTLALECLDAAESTKREHFRRLFPSRVASSERKMENGKWSTFSRFSFKVPRQQQS